MTAQLVHVTANLRDLLGGEPLRDVVVKFYVAKGVGGQYGGPVGAGGQTFTYPSSHTVTAEDGWLLDVTVPKSDQGGNPVTFSLVARIETWGAAGRQSLTVGPFEPLTDVDLSTLADLVHGSTSVVTVGIPGGPGPAGPAGDTGPAGPAGPAGAPGGSLTIIPGSGIAVDGTDPANPIVSATFGGDYSDLTGAPSIPSVPSDIGAASASALSTETTRATTAEGVNATAITTEATARATADAGKQDTSAKGAAGGYASLDGAGKVPLTQLPAAIMTYEGLWNASTNTPSLADGAGDVGQVYRVSVAGTRNLGSGSISYDVGDYVIQNASAVWEKSDTTDAVASVAGLTGVITASALRTALALVIGANAQAWDADLDAIAALSTTTFGRALLTEASASTLKANLAIAESDVSGLVSDLSAKVAKTLTLAGLDLTANRSASDLKTALAIAESDVTGLTTDLAAKVATSRTVNGHALSSNVTVTAGDVGAATSTLGGAETFAAFPALTGTVTLDASAASTFSNTSSLTGAITVAFSNVPASGTSCTLTVSIVQDATLRAVTWPAAVLWSGGSAPTQTASKTCVATLWTHDGGTTWYAAGGLY